MGPKKDGLVKTAAAEVYAEFEALSPLVCVRAAIFQAFWGRWQVEQKLSNPTA
jgi:hypothetical protein